MHNKKLAATLAAATCALLGVPELQASENDTPWTFDTAILYYGETERVSLIEGVFAANKDFGDEHIFSGKVVVDALTGASATGAVAQPSVQTFTRPSGNGQYQTAAGDTPLDDTFKDTRVQLNAQWTQPIMKDTRVSAGINLSNEYDYFSAGINGSVAKDFDRKNRTLSLGLSYQFDSIDPVGLAPLPFSKMVNKNDFSDDDSYQSAFDATRNQDSQEKDTIDLVLGFTQVINKRMLMQFNYGLSVADGYLNDPYKVLSQVDTQGLTQSIVHENRPQKRTKQNIYWQTKYAMDVGVIDVSYRYATDDWEIDSHTIDSRFRFNLSDASYIQPHIRYYRQAAADFYQPFLINDAPLPEFASADYRLGEMTAFTIGMKYGHTLSNGREWGFRLEYYEQSPENAGFDAPAALENVELYPSVKAIIAQVSYRF